MGLLASIAGIVTGNILPLVKVGGGGIALNKYLKKTLDNKYVMNQVKKVAKNPTPENAKKLNNLILKYLGLTTRQLVEKMTTGEQKEKEAEKV